MTTKQELQNKIDTEECLKKERAISDKMYAIKLVEKIVFGLVGLVLTGVVTALITLIIKK